MTTLDVSFHEGQGEVWNDSARMKVVIAGRRFGKTYYVVRDLGIHACMTHDAQGRSLKDFPIYYIAPTRDNAKRNTWRHFKNFLDPFIDRAYEKDLILRLKNGRELHLHGADNPDALRGDGLHRAGLDEYADMKPEVWGEVVRPMLTDIQGGAVFIGTRKPACNLQRLAREHWKDPDWSVFRFDSTDNPFLAREEVETARKDMSARQFIQEFKGSGQFEGGEVFNMEMFEKRHTVVPITGMTYIAMDPAGFMHVGAGRRKRIRSSPDYHAIAVVTVDRERWYVREIDYGHWDTREAAIHFLNAVRKYKPTRCGIEKGSLKNAMEPYLKDLQKQYGIFIPIIPLSHGGQQKAERIRWALEGRFEKKRVSFEEGEYVGVLRDEAMNFPNPLEHDDLLDALAYIDQLAIPSYISADQFDTAYSEPLDQELMI